MDLPGETTEERLQRRRAQRDEGQRDLLLLLVLAVILPLVIACFSH